MQKQYSVQLINMYQSYRKRDRYPGPQDHTTVKNDNNDKINVH